MSEWTNLWMLEYKENSGYIGGTKNSEFGGEVGVDI